MKIQDHPLFPNPDDPDWPLQLNYQLTNLHRQVANSINLIAEGKIEPHYSALTSIPTTGTHAQGDMIRNSTPTEQGAGGSKYVIFAWICVASGSPGTWKECRVLTGA